MALGKAIWQLQKWIHDTAEFCLIGFKIESFWGKPGMSLAPSCWFTMHVSIVKGLNLLGNKKSGRSMTAWFQKREAGLLLGLRLNSESEVAQSCPTLCDPMDCSLSGSSVHGIFQARVLEWIAISFPRVSSQESNPGLSCSLINSGSWWWTGRPGVLRFMGSQRVGHNWATELNWIGHLKLRPASLLCSREKVENTLMHQRTPEPKTSDCGPSPTRRFQRRSKDCGEPVCRSWYQVALRCIAL